MTIQTAPEGQAGGPLHPSERGTYGTNARCTAGWEKDEIRINGHIQITEHTQLSAPQPNTSWCVIVE